MLQSHLATSILLRLFVQVKTAFVHTYTFHFYSFITFWSFGFNGYTATANHGRAKARCSTS